MVWASIGENMNSKDRENLHFLLNISQEVFDDWIESVDCEDIEYALELVREAKLEIIERQIARIDEVNDTSQAQAIIEAIKNKR
jgi:hypothetical protein